MSDPRLLEVLRADVGRTGTPRTARDPVNMATIRTWCDAMSEANPCYCDPVAAKTGPHGELVAPPAMLQVWTMPGLVMGAKPPGDANEPSAGVYKRLDEAGYVSVVATDTEHVYHRYLRPGDVIAATTTLVDVSEEKQTGLGIGHFVTTEVEYHDQSGAHVGSMFFRVLKFRPGTGRRPPQRPDPARQALADAGLDPDEVLPPRPRPTRPRPQWNQNQAWFWEGLANHQFRPAAVPRHVDTLAPGDVSVDDRLPLCPIPIDPLLIVSTALATRDYQDVHHDRDLAQAKGSKDIFMNILTTAGLCNRWLGDWAGPDAGFRNLKIRLGAPNYPDDIMTMSGSVTSSSDDGVIGVGFLGSNALGTHVTGTAELLLPSG